VVIVVLKPEWFQQKPILICIRPELSKSNLMPLGRIHEPSMDPPGPSMEQVHRLGHQNMHWVNEPVHGLLSINPPIFTTQYKQRPLVCLIAGSSL